MQISWKHDHTYLNNDPPIDKKIDVFEARILGWQLHVADLIINGGRDHEDEKDVALIPHAAFAVLQISLAYFETIAKYEDGYTGHDSKRYFVRGMQSVFPQIATSPFAATQEFLDTFYSGARCGLYHMSITAPGIAVARSGVPITFSSNPAQITIDPHTLIPALEQHFSGYISRLRDSTETELRRNFEKCLDHGRKGRR